MNKKIIILGAVIIILVAIGISYLITTDKHKHRHIAPHGVTAPAKVPPAHNIITDKDINPDGYDDQSYY
jgi:hypothetical protein